eukprot:9011844-Pyramimonas_sp.AAC.1
MTMLMTTIMMVMRWAMTMRMFVCLCERVSSGPARVTICLMSSLRRDWPHRSVSPTPSNRRLHSAPPGQT